jgi:ABC-type Fe3+-hydroxamate transport system substrate-binding protein
MSDINTFKEAVDMINLIGQLTDKQQIAQELNTTIEQSFNQLGNIGKSRSVLYFIWDEPSFVVGKSTFIDSVLTKIGFVNACQKERYPALSDLEPLNPDFIFLSSEPFPFKEEHFLKFEELFPTSKIQFVDGESFSWYGSRMLEAPSYFSKIV